MSSSGVGSGAARKKKIETVTYLYNKIT